MSSLLDLRPTFTHSSYAAGALYVNGYLGEIGLPSRFDKALTLDMVENILHGHRIGGSGPCERKGTIRMAATRGDIAWQVLLTVAMLGSGIALILSVLTGLPLWLTLGLLGTTAVLLVSLRWLQSDEAARRC
jgi:hypothetical protein